jgi:16S rRNA G1207 methylase RsmC
MGVKVFVFSADEVSDGYEVTCLGCGWGTIKVYVLADSKEEALELAKDGAHLCGECLAAALAEQGREVA